MFHPSARKRLLISKNSRNPRSRLTRTVHRNTKKTTKKFSFLAKVSPQKRWSNKPSTQIALIRKSLVNCSSTPRWRWKVWHNGLSTEILAPEKSQSIDIGLGRSRTWFLTEWRSRSTCRRKSFWAEETQPTTRVEILIKTQWHWERVHMLQKLTRWSSRIHIWLRGSQETSRISWTMSSELMPMPVSIVQIIKSSVLLNRQ